MITFACVRAGTKYGVDYVLKLRNMIAAHYSGEHRYICLTDQTDVLIGGPGGVDIVNTMQLGLGGWWTKMALFSPDIRGTDRVVYLDLDTVIVGNLKPLADWDGYFGICENFTRLAGHEDWPCKFGSCVMSFAPGWGRSVWNDFNANRELFMKNAAHGDQSVIEELVPKATLLQSVLPAGFFLNKRELPKYPDGPPISAALVIFGGNERPDNCEVGWVRTAWN